MVLISPGSSCPVASRFAPPHSVEPRMGVNRGSGITNAASYWPSDALRLLIGWHVSTNQNGSFRSALPTPLHRGESMPVKGGLSVRAWPRKLGGTSPKRVKRAQFEELKWLCCCWLTPCRKGLPAEKFLLRIWREFRG